MQTDVQQIYQQTISPLPDDEQLKLASLILEKVIGKNANENQLPRATGALPKTFGMWQGKEFTHEEYLQLDHNERIDFDLARAYANNHEDAD